MNYEIESECPALLDEIARLRARVQELWAWARWGLRYAEMEYDRRGVRGALKDEIAAAKKALAREGE
jgi:hypothetical protein